LAAVAAAPVIVGAWDKDGPLGELVLDDGRLTGSNPEMQEKASALLAAGKTPAQAIAELDGSFNGYVYWGRRAPEGWPQ
jgi:hypothetical protein